MIFSTRVSDHPIYRIIVWCTLYTFVFNIFSYSILGYDNQPEPRVRSDISLAFLIDSVAELFVSEAMADTDEIVGEESPSQVPIYRGASPGDNRDMGVTGGSGGVNSVMGAYGYSYPIEVPEGRGGLTPSLALTYSSMGPNTFLGPGWSLALGSIQRSTKKTVPTYTDSDTFVITLKGINIELVMHEGEYRLKHEGLFLRIIKSGDSWIATDKSGTRYFFGSSDQSKVPGTCADVSGTFRWHLDRMEDANGNYMIFTYWKDPDSTGAIYPKHITYAGHTSGQTPNYTIHFYYQSRPDNQISYVTGFKTMTAYRLSHISVNYQDDLIRAYRLHYRTDLDGDLATSFLDQVQLYGNDAALSAVDAEPPTCTLSGGSTLPPVVFDYTTQKTPYLNHMDVAYDDNSGSYWWDRNFYPLDYNGDGKADLFTTGSCCGDDSSKWWELYQGEGDSFTRVANGGSSFYGVTVNRDSEVYPGDFNGDGLADLLIRPDTEASGATQLFFSNGEGFDAPINGPTLQGSNLYPSRRDELYVGDFNGDSRSDILVKYQVWKTTCVHGDNTDICTTRLASVGWRMYLSNGNGFDLSAQHASGPRNSAQRSQNFPFILGDYNGDGHTDVIMRYDADLSPDISFNGYELFLSTGTNLVMAQRSGSGFYEDSRPNTGDFNGDGRTDLLVNGDCGQAGFNLFFSKGDHFVLGQHGDFIDCKDVARTGDFNGDGRTDVLVTAYKPKSTWDGYYIHISNGSGLESYPSSYREPNWPGWSERFYIADFNGDGLSDFFVTDNPSENNRWAGLTLYQPVTYLNLDYHTSMPQNYPRLLGKITDSMGASQEITYVPSTVWPKEQGYILPGVFPTVQAITTKDNMPVDSHTTTTQYSYENGHFALDVAEFRGFQKVMVEDLESGITSESTFLQDGRYQGRMIENISRDRTGARAVQTVNTWNGKEYAVDDGYASRVFVYLQKSVTTHFDTDDAALSVATTHCDYDDFGNMISEDKTITNKKTNDVTTRFTRSEYINDTADWILDKPAWVRIDNTDPGPPGSEALRQTSYVYESARPWLLAREKQVYWDNGQEKEVAVTYDYDTYGNTIRITNPRNSAWAVTTDYSESGGLFPNWAYNALGHSSHNVFDPLFGKVVSETNVNGRTTTYTYDAFGRPATITNPENATTTFAYHIEAGNHYATVATPLKPLAKVFYDNLDREIRNEVTDGTTTIVTETYYDVQGRVYKKSLPYQPGDTVYYKESFYDARGRLETHTNPDGTLKQFAYEGFDEILTDENLNVKRITKDSFGRLVKVTEPIGGVTEYLYDLFDNLIWVNDPMGNQTNIYYDGLGRKIAMDDPYMGHWSYRYDNAGNLVWQLDGQGRIVEMTYDPLNRIETKTFTDTGRVIEYYYDEGRGGYFNIGALTTQITTEPASFYHRIEHDYDQMGRGAHDKQNIDGVDYNTYQTFDLAGRLKQIVYPANSAVFEYDYSSMGYLDLVEQVTVDGTRAEMVRYSDFNAMGQIGLATYGNGVTTHYTYKSGSQMLKHLQTTADTGGGNWTDIQNLAYTFDDAGNIDTISDSVNQVNYNFTYDSVHRLTSATAAAADADRAYDQTYTYDLAGNMTAKTGKGAFMVTAWNDQFKHIRPTQVMYQNGINGLGGRQVVYNQENKPTAITYKGVTTHLYYEGGGSRIKKQADGGAATIYVGGLYEIRGSEILINVFAGGNRIATLKNGEAFYTHGDHLGSTALVTNSQGVRVEEIGYLPFGATLYRKAYQGGYWDSVYRFTGQEYDSEYDLYNYNARLYDPVMCRFTTADTIVPDWTNPQTLNRYSYVSNNPLKYTDPSGHVLHWAAAIFISMYVGAIVGGIMAYMNGGSIAKGMFYGAICGAISGALFYVAGTLCSSAQLWQKVAVHAFTGAVSGAVNAMITGGDVGQGMMIGAFSAGASKWLGGKMGVDSMPPGPDEFAARTALGAVIGGVTSAMAGGDFAQGAFQGALSAALGIIANDEAHRAISKYLSIINGYAGIPGNSLVSSIEGFIGCVRPADTADVQRYGLDPLMPDHIVYNPNDIGDGYIGSLSIVIRAYHAKYYQMEFNDFLIDLGLSSASLGFAIGSAVASDGLVWGLWAAGAACDTASLARSGDKFQVIPSALGNPAIGKIGGVLGVGGSTINFIRSALR